MNDPSPIPNKTIEEEAAQLVQAYEKELGTRINPPIPVFEIIEFLGYNLDFRSDGFYKDNNNLGGLHIDEKLVVINENLAEQEGRMHFTAAHEIGHIRLHVPIFMKQKAKENILCRKDEGFEGTKKNPREWQADTFAAYLLMPRDMVNDAFKKVSYHPITLKKKRFLNLFMKTRSARQRSLWIAENVINEGGFENVSKLAMANRLIGLGLLKGLNYQKNIAMT
jgi:Zn-dependent peptidase ImmA (M78 family)